MIYQRKRWDLSGGGGRTVMFVITLGWFLLHTVWIRVYTVSTELGDTVPGGKYSRPPVHNMQRLSMRHTC